MTLSPRELPRGPGVRAPAPAEGVRQGPKQTPRFRSHQPLPAEPSPGPPRAQLGAHGAGKVEVLPARGRIAPVESARRPPESGLTQGAPQHLPETAGVVNAFSVLPEVAVESGLLVLEPGQHRVAP